MRSPWGGWVAQHRGFLPFEVVLAHEFGHLAGAHSRFTARIYRIRASGTQLTRRVGRV
jgi:hypothetical protein